MDIQIEHTLVLYVVDCATCGTPFGIAKQLEKHFRSSHESFFCPSGHSNVYAGESEAERLKRELVRKDQQLKEVTAQNEKLRRDAAIATVHSTHRSKQSCPHCGKKYKHLQQHIKIMHAETLINA